jgi:predicted TIM-barrel fold metal-dependent hydrolase
VIDSHAHAWDATCRIVPEFYAPEGDSPISRLLAVMALHEVAGAVLVQPSFLGTDNSYLLSCLAMAEDMLRGVVVIDATLRERELAAMDQAGVRGIRFNLLGGAALPDLSAGGWPAILRFMRQAQWHIELAARGPQLPQLLDALAPTRLPVVVAHFGLPDPERGVDCPGFRRLLSEAARVCVKASAPYRLGGLDPIPLIEALVAADVPLLWGSDFPHTQHPMQDYGTLLELADDLPDPEGEAEVLYGF